MAIESATSPAAFRGMLRTDFAPAGRAQHLATAAWAFARRHPLSAAGAVFLVMMVALALAAPVVAPYDPLAIAPLQRLQDPTLSHPMGTDNLGRDVFSRIIYGGRISLAIGFWSVVFGTASGAVIGIASGYYGGKIDMCVQRVVDAMQSFPALLLALALVSVLGTSERNVIIAIAFVVAPQDSRIVRSAVLQVRGMDYMQAARSVGVSDVRLMFRHVLPNVMAPIVILASVTFGAAILIEASLSFLGLGTPPPAPSWGGMLSGSGRQFLESKPLLAVFPGLAISLSVLSLNLLGDGLREALDPRMRGRG